MPVERPEAVVRDVARLAGELDRVVPPPVADNLLIATWNVRAFGDLTDAWKAGPSDSPKRDLHALACITEVMSRFDVVAVQEVKRDVTALRRTLTMLGPSWRVIASDVTEGDAGNAERLAFLYNSDRVQPSGLVGEIVLPIAESHVPTQFARTPYVVGFESGGTEFVLVSLHVLWGENAQSRLGEITAIAEWMRGWADRPRDWNHNLIVLGDFNLDRVGDPLFEAFLSTGLWPPAELTTVPRTIFDTPGKNHFYDQIVWFADDEGTSLLESLTYTRRGGSIDFVPHVMTDLTRQALSWKVSDHLPLWVEFTHPPR